MRRWLALRLFPGLSLTLLASALTLAHPAWSAGTGPITLGILNDQSGPYAAIDGPSSVDAARMAVEDFGGSVLGRKVEIVGADHQNKADLGSTIARKWFDVDGMTAIMDVAVSSVALAVQEIARERNKIVIYSGAGTSVLTGKACSPTSIHWTYDTYALTAGTSRALAQRGDKSWFFVTSDNAFGAALQSDATKALKAAGGSVLGTALHPAGMADFSSYVLQAQASPARIVALANAGEDTMNAVKTGREFGLDKKQQMLGLLTLLPDVHGLGLEAAQGLLVTESFYWNADDQSRAFAKRFFARNKAMPHMVPAGVYGSVLHYLKAVQAAGTTDTAAVMAAMKAMPINDIMTKNGRIREDGRVVREFHLYRVKSPAESREPWDYYTPVATIPAEDAARPLSESECPLVRKP
ncbi:ABC transporter permease [Azospirillum thiophilum]|uniref:ABC transporter permease n=1 Tax=Azospirillum thiophilum TaxID=528244 RepID=A0AAC9EY43_9PROT|nr:ABC transporter substrate-binding protein [Azospirillum thiophilum]ALG73582.1 ABC transporter permease [Azospirillum thiophilum]KJR62971.1 ABC transporter permease [Azospirillum thiophilum]